ncbi:MAG: type I-E CRISPR-associated protein Cas6/Cse3/CasE [Deltaproteobacteria bacterium]|nr:type I-E CRISPR-associated protein Cas6/Cse3/CasE [Deltaproteobacteria bacterium]
MNLSRLLLNPMNRDVRRAIADAQVLHGLVMKGFPTVEGNRHGGSILHRCELDRRSGQIVLYVQSGASPSWNTLPAGVLLDLGEELQNPAVRSLDPLEKAVRQGAVFRFRLRANVTRKIPAGAERPNGTRVPIREADKQLEWLQRKAATAGFRIQEPAAVWTRPEARAWGTRKGARLTFEAVTFDGLLEVVEPAALLKALASGIGPAKAYGCGLLSLAP